MRRVFLGLWSVLLVAGLCLVGSVPASAAALPQSCTYGPCGPTGVMVVVSVTQQPNGVTQIDVSISAFGHDETVDFYVHSVSYSVGSTVTNSSGQASLAITLPAGLAAGTHTLTAVGTRTGTTATTTFTLARATAGLQPCTAGLSSAAGDVVLAACLNQVPAAAPPAAAGAPQAAHAPQSSLPFTGTDARLTAGVAAVLVASGGVLVLASRKRRRGAWRSTRY
jgi:hypothetical protein